MIGPLTTTEDNMRLATEDKVMLGFIAALIIGVAALIVLAIQQSGDYEAACKAIGGHTKTDTTTVTTVSGNGQVGTGTSSNTYCLSSDGRILEP